MKRLHVIPGKLASRSARHGCRMVAGRRANVRSESGAILILALIYLVVISVTVAALATWSTNDINNSAHFSDAGSLQVAATGMMDVAIQYVRYNTGLSTTQEEEVPSALVACWGTGTLAQIPTIDGNKIAVWCSTTWNPLSQDTRDVMFYACPISITAASCASGNALLTAEVYYDDYPPPPASAPIQVLCTVWCGQGMTIHEWSWGASLPGSAVGVASSLSFTTEPSDTLVGTATNAAVTVIDADGNPVAGDSVSIVVQSGPTPLDNLDNTSTLLATTNSNGVASFTDLLPDYAGNYTLTAVDGALSTTSSNFVVGKGLNSISVTSTAPTTATAGSSITYTATAAALSLDDVNIASATMAVCTVPANSQSPATVSFKTAGTCTLDFTDAGNQNYEAATTMATQSFQVASSTPTQVVLTPSSSTPAANGSTNDAITLQLENVVGVATTSTGTTTLKLSDTGSGFFATGNNASGAATLSVSFANGVGTATPYFGDEGAGLDTISALNGTATWGTTTVTVRAGSAAKVAISPSSTTPQESSTANDALTLQLQDQFGNNVTSSGTTTLAMSDSSGGFFAAGNNASGAATLNVSFADGVGTATAYFGDQTTGSSIITAKNGTASWGTSTLTVGPRAPSEVSITISPSTPSKSSTTNASVTIQLEDANGNPVATSGYTFTLSDTNNGFFANSNGTWFFQANSTISVTTNSSGVAVAYFGDRTDSTDTITAVNSSSTWGSTSFSL